MFDNSFTWWFVNFAISIIWLGGSIATGNYFLAIGGILYLGVMMLIELPGTSSEEGSNDPDNESPDDGIDDSIPNF